MEEQIGLEIPAGLVAFARAGSLGSYTAAGRALGVSPSAVSKSVQRLERQLGIVLFTRTTRSLTLTAEGRELHDRALELLRGFREFEQAAAASRSEPSGRLRIATSLPIAINVVAPGLPAFQRLHPKVEVDLRVGDTFVDLIGEGIDVAVRIGELADSRLMSRRLAPHRLCCFASPRYLEARGTPSHPDELEGHSTVSLRYQSSGQPMRWQFSRAGSRMELTPPSATLVDSSDALVAVLVAGGGVGLGADFIAAPHVRRGDLVPVLADWAVTRDNVTAIWPASRTTNPAVRAFLQHLDPSFRASMEAAAATVA